MNTLDLNDLNDERAKVMHKTLLEIHAFPVLVCGLTVDHQLVVFGFSGVDKSKLKIMLQDYLDSLDDTEYVVEIP